MYKVYLDTSVISALFDIKNPDRQDLTQMFFAKIKSFDVYISKLTLTEINNTKSAVLKDKMLGVVFNFNHLTIDKKIEGLTENYINYNAIPEKYKIDAYHITTAVLNEMDYLLSWNFKHLLRLKTKDIVRMVNTLSGYKHIEIITPAEII